MNDLHKKSKKFKANFPEPRTSCINPINPMKTAFFSLALLILLLPAKSQNLIPEAEAQIKAAVLAAPADKRQQAMVYGYNKNKELVVLRKGSNELVCLADDPD